MKRLCVLLLLCSCDPPSDARTVRVPPTNEVTDVFGLTFTVSDRFFDGDIAGVQIAGDPDVHRINDDTLHMAYSCFAVRRVPQGLETCLAVSTDNGQTWRDQPSTLDPDGAIISPGNWDTHHETPMLLVEDAGTQLYFVGYADSADDDVHGIFGNTPVSVGRATSSDGLRFTKSDEPVLAPSDDPAARDAHGFSSPNVLRDDDGSLVMLYSGLCLTAACTPPYASLLAARSLDNGLTWTRIEEPVVLVPEGPLGETWAPGGIGEAGYARLPDGRWLMLAAGLQTDDGPQPIVLAVADDLLGPWQFADAPILLPGESGGFGDRGIVAPSIVVEDGRIRVWFHGFTSNDTIRIAYAEAVLP